MVDASSSGAQELTAAPEALKTAGFTVPYLTVLKAALDG